MPSVTLEKRSARRIPDHVRPFVRGHGATEPVFGGPGEERTRQFMRSATDA